jgi:thiol-disulfide isomerase/thioredoxin
MNQELAIGIVALVIIAGGIGIYSSNNSKTEMVKSDVVMQKEGSVLDTEKNKTMMSDSHVLGVLFSKGKIMTIWEMNQLAHLDHDIILKNGTNVSMNGRIVDISGKIITLKDGQELTTDGSIQKIDMSKMMTMVETDTMMKGGTYEAYSPEKIATASSTHKVVLFFHASWCPTCIALDKDIKSHLNNIPSSLTIFDVDYDTSLSLKQKYGVTYQHTFVEVDAQGNMIKKWSGSPTLAALVSEVK